MVEALSIDPFDSNHWLVSSRVKILYGGSDFLISMERVLLLVVGMT